MTIAPLPTILELIEGFLLKKCIDKIDWSIWKKDNLSVIPLSKSSWSLFILAQYYIMKQGSFRILIPDYFCNESLEPLRLSNVNIIYYPLTNEFEPDYEYISGISTVDTIDAFLLVHYFGRISNTYHAKEFTVSKNMLLIEDCAHLIAPLEKSVGVYSDFQIYSLYKHIPMPDGALLVVKSNQELSDFASTYLESKEKLPKLKELKWIIKKTILKILESFNLNIWFNKRHINQFKTLYNDSKIYDYIKMSQYSINRMSTFSEDFLMALINNRMNNFNVLKSKYTSSVEQLDTKSGIPYFYICKYDTFDTASEIYNEIFEEGLIALSWPDLIQFSDEYNASKCIKMRKHLIFLPLHGRLKR